MEEIDCDWSQLSIIYGGLASTYSSPLKMLNFQHISSCSFAIYIQFVDLIDIWALHYELKRGKKSILQQPIVCVGGCMISDYL